MPEEKRYFFALLRRLRARGVAIVFISHALEEALQTSDRITILRDGEHVATDETHRLNRDSIIAAMVGRGLSSEIYRRRSAEALRPAGAKALSVQDLSPGAMVRNNAFSIFHGQVTGILGLVGAGRTETAKVIAGVLKRDSTRGGVIELDGRPVRYLRRTDARRGLGAIAEIHQFIAGLADEGLAVIVISSYLPEVLNLSDRILVLRQGRCVEEFSPAEVDQERIMYAAAH